MLFVYGEVYYSESFKNINIYTSSAIKSSIKFTEQHMLEFNFKIEGIDQSEIKNILKSLKEQKKYYRLKKRWLYFS
jgi:hypothetical protein